MEVDDDNIFRVQTGSNPGRAGLFRSGGVYEKSLSSDTTSRQTRRDNCGLQIQDVEGGFGQQEVDASVDESFNLLEIGCPHLVKAYRPEPGSLDVRGQRQGSVHGTYRASDESWFPR